MASEQVGELSFGLADLSDVRRVVALTAIEAGMSEDRAADVVLACNEIATNAIVHGRPPATIRVWEEDGNVVCEVKDAGCGIKDPHPGQEAPSAEASAGRGLWIARQLCDRLEINDGVGCTVSIHAGARSRTSLGQKRKTRRAR